MNHRRIVPIVNSLLLINLAAHAQTYIFGRADFAVGSVPTSIASGDFNGDGITDFAVTNSNDNTVSILLGKPDGTFAPQVAYATGAEPVAVVTGDFNGDGNSDLAIANGACTPPTQPLTGPTCNSTTISVLLGNGDGTFQPHLDIPVGKFPSSIVAADFNGDGKLDLVVTNTLDSTVSVLLGNGNGTFQAQVVYPTAAPALYGQSIVVGDFNGDGKLDLAVTCAGGVSVLLGNGDGTFGKHLDSLPADVPLYPVTLAVGDFNGDGKPDLIAGNEVMLGNGDGTFYAFASTITAMAAADLNGDGKLDLVGLGPGNSYEAAIALGNGDGTFQAPVNYGTGYLPSAVGVADLNGDGKLDITFADAGCQIETEASCSGYKVPPGQISVLLGLGNGKFVGSADYAVASSGLISADFNHDGNLDLAATDSAANSVSILLGKGDGTFQLPLASYATGTTPGGLATGDLGNSGVLDLVTANSNCTSTGCSSPGSVSVLFGNGNGTFQTNKDYGVGLNPGTPAIGDFRNDSKLDLAVVDYLSGIVSILLGNGDGTFQPQVTYPTTALPQQAVIGDFNNDGRSDLAVVGSGLSILLGNGDGTFKPHVDLPVGGGSIVTADFNGDGNLDLAVGGFDQISILLGNGDGTFQAPVNYPTDLGTSNLDAPLVVGNFNQAGKLDLATQGSFPSAVLLLGNGDGTFQTPAIHYDLPGGSSFTVGDFNGDGVPDWASGTSGFANDIAVMLSTSFQAISPNSLNFGSEGIGTTSAPQTITISNPSNVKISTPSISASANFAETDTCKAPLTPGSSCKVSVTFSPTGTGSDSGTITVTDSTPVSPLAIPVKGSGVNGAFLTYPVRQNFSPLQVGTSSSPSALTLANTGNATLNIAGISILGTNSSDFSQSSKCGSALSAGGSCSVSVRFTPTAPGSRTASLTINDNAPGSPQTVALSGMATEPPNFTLGAMSGSPISQTINAGSTASFTMALESTGSFSGTVNLSCAIAPVVSPAPTCSLPASVQVNSSLTQSASLNVATTASVTTAAVPPIFSLGAMPLACTLILLGLGWPLLCNRKRAPALALPMVILVFASGVGCGGGGGGSSSHTTPGTPPGTYSATITATSGSLDHSMTFTVVVN